MHDPGICAHGTAALAEWYLGRPDTALAGARRTLELARSLQHPYSELLALINLVWIHGLRGEAREARAIAREAIDLCDEHHFPNYLAYARFLHGWACVMGGDHSALEEMHDGLARYRSLGLTRHVPQLLAILAECLMARGALESAQQAVEQAAALLEQTGELRWTAEVHRVRGEVQLARSLDTAVAEGLLAEALTIARRQRARALELRAATSLARLWKRTERDAAADELLAAITNDIQEGHSTRDFREARALMTS
jgi:predicted ATPase